MLDCAVEKFFCGDITTDYGDMKKSLTPCSSTHTDDELELVAVSAERHPNLHRIGRSTKCFDLTSADPSIISRPVFMKSSSEVEKHLVTRNFVSLPMIPKFLTQVNGEEAAETAPDSDIKNKKGELLNTDKEYDKPAEESSSEELVVEYFSPGNFTSLRIGAHDYEMKENGTCLAVDPEFDSPVGVSTDTLSFLPVIGKHVSRVELNDEEEQAFIEWNVKINEILSERRGRCVL